MALPMRCGTQSKVLSIKSYKLLNNLLLLTVRKYAVGPKKKPIPKFVDFLQLQVTGGTGGQGLPKYGGFGGNGGKIFVTAKAKVKNLRQLAVQHPKQTCKAGVGDNSSKFHLLGNSGKDLNLEVPVGVLLHTEKGDRVDLNKEGDSCIVANGGIGGNRETNFLGLRGQTNMIGLELKLLADVGLVGFPNAGKSTFLRAVSKAKPKVAAYPFTTLTPQLGIMEFDDGRRISVADLPGLIEGAHQNYGKGIKFLRHAERTKLLLFVLDLNPFQLSEKYPERSAFETLLLLNQELEAYGHGMLDKPAILAINKTDTDPSGEKVTRLMSLVQNLPESLETVDEELRPTTLAKFDDILTMSAQNRDNIEAVRGKIREVMDEYAEKRLLEELEKKKSLMSLREDEEHLKTTFV
ncbi:GTP-binding protein 10 homolog [Aplysia californica]|uniref:GTP-binding protein 10 homolog n=1 Tax=Aplysia californica TaxID=6500 RepID=A0ABM1A3Q8_APLCA|nr:GTP-binding protein 10 homolog [Aplysia californica]